MSRSLRITLITIALLVSTAPVYGQGTFDQWLNRRLMAMVNAAIPQNEDQVEPPSIADASTSLVDLSSAPDLVGLALDVAGALRGMSHDAGPTSLTVSGYTVRTAFTGENPLNPAVYAATENWRRWSVSVGREPSGDAGAAAHLVGVKLLAINSRDIGTAANQTALNGLGRVAMTSGIAFANMRSGVGDFLLEALQDQLDLESAPGSAERQVEFGKKYLAAATLDATLALLTPEQVEELDAVIASAVASQAALRDQISRTLRDIRLKPQFAFSYQSKLRAEGETDEHRWEAIYDYGLSDRLGLTLNGSFDVVDRKLQPNVRKGRIAGELQVNLARSRGVAGTTGAGQAVLALQRAPSIRLSVAGAAEWSNAQDEDNMHKVQAKVTIPVPQLKGLNIPISVTWASRTELIEESEVRGLVGFTVDFSKLADAFRPLGR